MDDLHHAGTEPGAIYIGLVPGTDLQTVARRQGPGRARQGRQAAEAVRMDSRDRVSGGERIVRRGSPELAGAETDAAVAEMSPTRIGVSMSLARNLCLSIALVPLLVPSVFAADPGKAVGTVTIDGVTTTLTLAAESTTENLFDSKKTDTLITLTDRALGDVAPNDDIGLSLRARRGDLVVVMLRIDGTKLANVSLMYKGLSGIDKLPGQWFQYAATGKSAGTLTLATRENDGHTYACTVAFTATPA